MTSEELYIQTTEELEARFPILARATADERASAREDNRVQVGGALLADAVGIARALTHRQLLLNVDEQLVDIPDGLVGSVFPGEFGSLMEEIGRG